MLNKLDKYMTITQRIIVINFLLCTVSTISFACLIFVSITGNDTTGTKDRIDLPFRTIPKAVSVALAGDTIYIRGGEYTYTDSSTVITLPAKTGSSTTNRCSLIGYNEERPLLNFLAMTGTSADGVKINGSYWYLKGLDFKGAPHNGLKISGGSYNIIELCNSYENRNTGIQLSSNASYNRFINCDSYNNRDAGDGNADGFSPKLDVGTGNYFYGCRTWQNSDDGWDGYLRPSDDVTDTLINCWSFMNGYYSDGITMGTGNGNGFKTGGCDTVPGSGGLRFLKHNMVLINCLSFYNKAKGFDQNHNRGSVTMLNCSAFNNGNGSTKESDQYNFAFPETLSTYYGKVLTIENSISLGSTYGIQVCPSPTPVVLVTNSWPDSSPYTSVATNDDFLSIDTSGVRGPRKADGSLPDVTFMQLDPSSEFVNQGTDVGLPYIGPAPDLGCFETNIENDVIEGNSSRISEFRLLQNYPNPFNPSTSIQFSVAKGGIARLKVVNILGQEIATLYFGHTEPGKLNTVQFDADFLPSGIYFSILENGEKRQVKKMMLIK
jgi:hypothetical protein